MSGPPARFLSARRKDIHDFRATSPFAYANRQLRSMVADLTAEANLPAGVRVFDYGCADQPYRELLPPGATYVGGDLPGNHAADLELREDGTVPVSDETFDLVLSTQVLEHVFDPARYLAECHRLLKPGGSLVLSTHGLMYYHRDPEDYWRWTPAGLRQTLAAAGFDVVHLRGLLGLAAAALQIFQDATYWFVPRRLRPVYALVAQRLIALADRYYTEELRAENSWVIAVRAVKQHPAAP